MSRSTVVSFVLLFSLRSVSLESLWILSSIPWAGCSRVSLLFSFGVSIEFPWAFLSLEFPNELGWIHDLSFWLSWGLAWSSLPWLIPVSPRWVLTSMRSIPAVIPLFRSGASMWVSFFAGRGCIPLSVWRLGAVLALSWHWVPSRASPWLWVLKSRTAGVLALFSEATLFAVGFLHQVSQLLSVHSSWTCENAKMVAYAGMKVP